jgi:hypothetical protein
MVMYQLFLQVKGVNKSEKYGLDFNIQEENNPRLKFTEEIRESLRRTLQNRTLCAINDYHLNEIVNTWIEDIEEGGQVTNIILDLPPLGAEKLLQINDQGNQEKPSLIAPDLGGIEPNLGMLPPLDRIFNC